MGENGEEAAAAINQAILLELWQKPEILQKAVRNPRRNERRRKSMAGMARRYWKGIYIL